VTRPADIHDLKKEVHDGKKAYNSPDSPEGSLPKEVWVIEDVGVEVDGAGEQEGLPDQLPDVCSGVVGFSGVGKGLWDGANLGRTRQKKKEDEEEEEEEEEARKTKHGG